MLSKLIYCIGKRNHMGWFRRLMYRLSDTTRWGLMQWIIDHPQKLDYEYTNNEFDEFLETLFKVEE